LIFYDKEGRVEAFDYERMVLYVTEVLKIQHKDIEVLQAEVAALKGEKSALTAANASLQKQQAEIGTQLDAILQKLKLLESGSKAGK
jgi:FtsZ-binding cell division protein ZapB